jgi:hypothetical protein
LLCIDETPILTMRLLAPPLDTPPVLSGALRLARRPRRAFFVSRFLKTGFFNVRHTKYGHGDHWIGIRKNRKMAAIPYLIRHAAIKLYYGRSAAL